MNRVPNRITLEDMIRNTDGLTYLNALKTAVTELKEELALLEQTREYQYLAIERARKIMRRIDNQYRALVKATAKLYHPPEVQVTPDLGLQKIIEEEYEDEQ